jgi:hypothetical protein
VNCGPDFGLFSAVFVVKESELSLESGQETRRAC